MTDTSASSMLLHAELVTVLYVVLYAYSPTRDDNLGVLFGIVRELSRSMYRRAYFHVLLATGNPKSTVLST